MKSASRAVTNRMKPASKGKATTKASKRIRKAHRRDDVKLLKQDLKYNLRHSADHKRLARLDRKLIHRKSKK